MIEYNKRNIRTWSMLGSRRLFGIVLEELVKEDDKFIFITADVGRYYAINRFIEKYPDKVINVGIAEQNMIGIAAGMAKEGFHPMVATYSTFATARVLDQIRVNMGLMKLGIVVVGVSSGLAEGEMSATHMGLEDIANMAAIPNINIFSPADCTETVKCLLASVRLGKPSYVRLTGTANCPIVYKEDYSFEAGKMIKLKSGNDLAIVATGSVVYSALKVAQKLEEENVITVSVFNIHTIKPMSDEIFDQLCKYQKVVTIEEHNIYGGLGSLLATRLVCRSERPQLLILGVEDFYPLADSYGELVTACKLSVEKIYNKIINFVGE